jgi:putative transposase
MADEPARFVREKKHRLDAGLYRGFNVVTFTCCILNRRKLFVTQSVFAVFEDILIHELERHGCQSHIYLFMPDHLHLTLQGKFEGSDIRKCLVLFKQKTGYWMSRNGTGFEWQKDFYDHVLRKDEDLVRHVRYILSNPVRTGMVGDWKEYPFKGSTVYDLNSW